MFASGSPELTLDMVGKSGEVEGPGESVVKRLGLRGGDSDSLKAMTQQGDYYMGSEETDRAIAAYREAVTAMAAPMNHLAWLYLQQGKVEEALPLSRLAVQLLSDEANFLDTLAEILLSTGEKQEASRHMKRVVPLDPSLNHKLERFK